MRSSTRCRRRCRGRLGKSLTAGLWRSCRSGRPWSSETCLRLKAFWFNILFDFVHGVGRQLHFEVLVQRVTDHVFELGKDFGSVHKCGVKKMRFNRTPLALAWLVIGMVWLLGLYFGYFQSSQFSPILLLIWNFSLSAIESTVRRSDIRQRGLLALSEAYSRCNGIYVMATLASSEEIYSKAYRDFEAWLTSTREAIQEFFSVDASEAFMVIGNETPGTMVLQLRQLHSFNEANRQVMLQWLEAYSGRLHQLMNQAPAIKRSWWLTPLAAPKSSSTLSTASSPAPK